jgi:chromosome segregation ATPase
MSFHSYLDDPTPEEVQRRNDATTISALEDEVAALHRAISERDTKIQKLKEMHALNEALPESYDLTDEATTELALDIAELKSQLNRTCAQSNEYLTRLVEVGGNLEDIADALEVARNRTQINNIVASLKSLAKNLLET